MKNKMIKILFSLGLGIISFIFMFLIAVYVPWFFLFIGVFAILYGIYDYYNHYIKKNYLQEKDWRIY